MAGTIGERFPCWQENVDKDKSRTVEGPRAEASFGGEKAAASCRTPKAAFGREEAARRKAKTTDPEASGQMNADKGGEA